MFRQKDQKTERQKDKKTNRQKDKKTERQKLKGKNKTINCDVMASHDLLVPVG